MNNHFDWLEFGVASVVTAVVSVLVLMLVLMLAVALTSRAPAWVQQTLALFSDMGSPLRLALAYGVTSSLSLGQQRLAIQSVLASVIVGILAAPSAAIAMSQKMRAMGGALGTEPKFDAHSDSLLALGVSPTGAQLWLAFTGRRRVVLLFTGLVLALEAALLQILLCNELLTPTAVVAGGWGMSTAIFRHAARSTWPPKEQPHRDQPIRERSLREQPPDLGRWGPSMSSTRNTGIESDDELSCQELSAWLNGQQLVRNVSIRFPARAVTALIGPSGCGKSSLIRCLNRLFEEQEGAQVMGEVKLSALNVYAAGVDASWLRRKVAMVFQRPQIFPALSIRRNVLLGLELNQQLGEQDSSIVERVLREVGLWEEVSHQLSSLAGILTTGQQQRLCIARALALQPQVLVMDEPCAVLDPIASAQVEDVIRELGTKHTVVVATHHLQQAARLADYTAFLNLGELVEFDRTEVLFTNPRSQRTEDYITGRYG